jgi:transketolase
MLDMIRQSDPLGICALETRARKVREHILRLTATGGCFIGAAYSCADLVVYLYSRFLNVDKWSLDNASRDYLFLSKGHAVPALYGTLAECGILEADRLADHLTTRDDLYWHPNRAIPGIEFHSGSLGHMVSVAAGVALDCKMKGTPNKVVVITGDGELNEGSMWEAMLVAAAYKLDNLIIIVDRNRLQANCATEDLIPLEPLEQKFLSFGHAVRTIDGHNFSDMDEVFPTVPFEPGRPNIVIADTVRGKGLSDIENRADRWFCSFSPDEVEGLLKRLSENSSTHGDAIDDL